jgi:hypothetical protein
MMLPRERYALGRGYSVEFHFDGLALAVEWLPKVPPPKIGRKLLPAYREARNQFLARLAPAYGPIAVVDL